VFTSGVRVQLQIISFYHFSILAKPIQENRFYKFASLHSCKEVNHSWEFQGDGSDVDSVVPRSEQILWYASSKHFILEIFKNV